MGASRVRGRRLPLLLVAVLAAVGLFGLEQMDPPSASAHQDPPACTTVGNSISLAKYRDTNADNIGDTLIPGVVVQGETIYFETTLAERGVATDCAIGGGDLFINPPGPVGPTDVSPSGVPCIGGATDGVGAINDCFPAPMCPEAAPQSCFTSDQLAYVVNCAHVVDTFLPVATNWSGGINHNAAHSPASASQSDAVTCVVPSIRIIKTAATADGGTVAPDGTLLTVEAGTNVKFIYEVCNTGEVTLIVTQVTDDNGTPGVPGDDFTVAIPAADQNFDPGECETVESGPMSIPDTGTACETPRINVGSVSGTSDPGGIVVNDDDPASVCVITPGIRIIKTAGSAVDGALETVEAGDQVTFHYQVCNIGETVLTVTQVTDDNGTPGASGDDFTVAIPAPDQNFDPGECESVDSNPIAVADTGTACDTPRVNVAGVTGTSPAGNQVSDDDPASVCALTPGMTIEKTAGTAPDGTLLTVEAGAQVVFHYKICNTGETNLTVTQVTDDNGTPGVPGDDFTVPVPGPDQLFLPGTCGTVHSDPITIPDTGEVCDTPRVNTGSASGTTPGGTTVGPVTDTASVCALTPGMSIVKTAGSAADGALETVEAGDQVVFHYRVCNTGEIALTITQVTDDNGTPGAPGDDFTVAIPAPDQNFEPGECEDVDSDPVTVPDTGTACETLRINVASASGTTDPGGTAVGPVTDPASVCALEPGLTIVKTAGSAADGALETVEAGDQVIFHYRVCNTGEIAIVVTSIHDNNGTPGNPGDDFDVDVPPAGPTGQTIPATNPDTCIDVDSAPVTIADTGTACETPRINIGSVSGTTEQGGTTVGPVTDPASVCALTPGIRIIKTANAAPDGSVLEIPEGVAITFHYEVCNTGETDLTVTQVTDDNGTPGVPGDDFTVPVPAADQLLTPGECVTVHSSPMTPTLPECGQTRVNTATVVGTTPAGTQVTDTDDAAACKPPAGGEGCTPGYWKQEHHFDSWVGYSPNQQFSSVFENAFPGMTLLQVLQQGGGGLKALGRHTVAALLNASSGGVDYEFTTAEVIQAFNNTFPAVGAGYEIQKNIFAQENERGCPLN